MFKKVVPLLMIAGVVVGLFTFKKKKNSQSEIEIKTPEKDKGKYQIILDTVKVLTPLLIPVIQNVTNKSKNTHE